MLSTVIYTGQLRWLAGISLKKTTATPASALVVTSCWSKSSRVVRCSDLAQSSPEPSDIEWSAVDPVGFQFADPQPCGYGCGIAAVGEGTA